MISVNEQRAPRRETFSIPDWTIGDLTTEVEEVGLPQRNGKVSLYRMTLPAERDPSYYLYKVIHRAGHFCVGIYGAGFSRPDRSGSYGLSKLPGPPPVCATAGLCSPDRVSYQPVGAYRPRVLARKMEPFYLGNSTD